MGRVFYLRLGPMADPFEQQLAGQGLEYNGDHGPIEHLDLDRKAISRLNLRGFIPDNVADKARLKLMGKFKGKVKPRGEKS